MSESLSTMVDLFGELSGLNYWSPGMQVLMDEAISGEYHDYKNRKYACGKVAVVEKLRAEASLPKTPRAIKDALRAMAERVIAGVYDERADDIDKEKMRRETPRGMWEILGL